MKLLKKVTSQEGLFFNFLKPLMSVRLPLAKSVLELLGLTASASATDAAIQKKIYGSNTTTLVFSNKT